MAPKLEPGAVSNPIPQSMLQRVLGGAAPIVTGAQAPIKPGDPAQKEGFQGWFGPFAPPLPAAPTDVAGRQFDYPSGRNVDLQPRSGYAVTFGQLRSVADSLDLLRMAIETRKDQMAKLEWSIMPRKVSGSNLHPKPTPQCATLESFFQFPDGKRDWNTWLREILEDLFVIDAPTLYARKRKDGGIYGFEVIDGSTIKIVIDTYGRTPDPPMVAYQQVLKGLPAVDYTTDELIYFPRNTRSHKSYGLSPCEQIIMTINIALRRQMWQLQEYTEGNIPEALITTPIGWNLDMIKEFQRYWDSVLEGNTAAQRHAKFVPAGVQTIWAKGQNNLKDEYDEWLARIVMYAFSLPVLPLVKQQNRSVAETAQEQALDEGLQPLMVWVKALIDKLLKSYFNAPELEFVWNEQGDLDPHSEAEINTALVQLGIKSIDEVRSEMGLQPVGMGNAIWGIGPMGITFIKDIAANQQAFAPQLPQAPDPMQGVSPGAMQASGVNQGSEQEPQLQGAPTLPNGQPKVTIQPKGTKNPAFNDPAVKAALGKKQWRTGVAELAKRGPVDLKATDYP